MPYPTNASLPQAVKDKIKSPKRRRQWRHVWESEMQRHGDESRAFAGAWSAVQKAATISKDAAEYVYHPVSGQQCSGCSMFRGPGDCTLVKGVISPRGHCKYYKAKPMKKSATGEPDAGFNFFLPLTKVEAHKDGTCTVSGYASTPALDLDGEIVSLDAVKKALPGYWAWRNIREMHQASAVGVAKEANVDDKGLFLTARIVDKDAVKKCLEGVYKGYSIGGKKLAKNGNTITEIELVEVSVVDRPANPECKIEVAKRAKDAGAAYLIKMASPRDPRSRALNKMAQVVEILARDQPVPDPEPVLKSDPAQSVAEANLHLCKKHGIANCAKCAAKVAKKLRKREFKQKQREALASSGAAMPDGSFPIENKKDLMNARHAVGRAKNPGAARAHIKRRAAALGVKLPDNWSKKLAKSLILKAIEKNFNLGSAQPSFLTLGAETASGPAAPSLGFEGDDGSGHEPGVEQFSLRKGGTKQVKKMAKRLGAAGSLSYCFDSLRDAQRSLMFEAKREDGDAKDAALARELGSIAQRLAGVISKKASHEGSEAVSLTDVDDIGLNLEDFAMSAKTSKGDSLEKFLANLAKRGRVPSRMQRVGIARANLKKARGARKEAEDAIKAAHAMHKAAYIAKMAKAAKGKKPAADDDADDFDHAGAMEKLQKAYGELEKLGTFVKAANVQLKKAASRSGERGQEAGDSEPGYTPPAGVTDLTPADGATAGPGYGQRGSEPPILGMDMNSPYPGKGAKGDKISKREAALIAKAAAAEAKVELLEKLPATPSGGRRPVAFDMNKLGGVAQQDKSGFASLFEGVDVRAIGSGDEQSHVRELGKVFGKMIMTGHGARSVMDPNFHGTVGG